jgi:hypothetical protein
MGPRALARATAFILNHLGASFLANLAVFFSLFPLIFFANRRNPVVLLLVGGWAWLWAGWLTAWAADRLRGGDPEGLSAMSRRWLRRGLARHAALYLVLLAFAFLVSLAAWFYGKLFAEMAVLRFTLWGLTLSLGLWGVMAGMAALAFSPEPESRFREILKRSCLAPVAFLPSWLFALAAAAYLSGAFGLVTLMNLPGASRWALLPLLLPLALVPALTLSLLAAFLACLADEVSMAALGFPPPVSRMPSIREVFMPWEL